MLSANFNSITGSKYNKQPKQTSTYLYAVQTPKKLFSPTHLLHQQQISVDRRAYLQQKLNQCAYLQQKSTPYTTLNCIRRWWSAAVSLSLSLCQQLQRYEKRQCCSEIAEMTSSYTITDAIVLKQNLFSSRWNEYGKQNAIFRAVKESDAIFCVKFSDISRKGGPNYLKVKRRDYLVFFKYLENGNHGNPRPWKKQRLICLKAKNGVNNPSTHTAVQSLRREGVQTLWSLRTMA